MEKIWRIKPAISEDFQTKFPEVNPVVLQLLFNRGLTDQEKIDEFQNPDYGQDIHDPFLFRDMDKAVNRIMQAIKQKEKIVVHGDYDADGVTSSVLLVETLTKLGAKQSDLYIYIPHRNTEGYGLNKETVKNLIDSRAQLIITVDCGISNKEEVEMAQQAGIDVIINDHHHVPEVLPPAYAIINPQVKDDNYPFAQLAGVGVAFKLAQALLKKNKVNGGFAKWLLDLVAIGSVADSVPLLGENRTLVRYGLVVLNKTRRAGLRALIEKSGGRFGELNSRSIGFQIAPRLNAAGRIGHANTAYQLLISRQEQSCLDLAEQLNKTNWERQQITERLTKEALAQVGEIKDKYLLFIEGQGEDWQPGIVGLIAGKIADKFFRPTFVISQSQGEYVGSGRSIDQLDIMEVLEKSRKHLHKFGGHPQACGFTLKGKDNLQDFKKEAADFVQNKLAGLDLRPQIEVDVKIELKEINWDLVEQLGQFNPFGEANPKPHFLAEELLIERIERVGLDKSHLKLLVSQGEEKKKIIAFGFGKLAERVKEGDKLKAILEIDTAEWNGTKEIQLKAIDLKKYG